MSNSYKENLIGKRFNRLLVTEFVPRPDKKPSYWKCICDCGTDDFVTLGPSLKNGLTQSCGCLQREKVSSNLLNQKFGKLLVIKKTNKRIDDDIVWHCKCDCGNTRDVRTTALKNKSIFSCGCHKHEDLIGRHFNKVTLLHPTLLRTNSKKIYWLCECDCKTQFHAIPYNVIHGLTTSCGCNQVKDYTNQRFGKLVAIKPTEIRSSIGSIMWECNCDCGNSTLVSSHGLSKGTKSCGCLKSYGEERIKNILNQYDIHFISETKFIDLISAFNYCLRFDFGIYDDDNNLLYLIEFDGSHHFCYTDINWNTKDQFEKTKLYDDIKNQYCLENKILLIRIPYTQLNNIDVNMLKPETSKYLMQTENNFINYYKTMNRQ